MNVCVTHQIQEHLVYNPRIVLVGLYRRCECKSHPHWWSVWAWMTLVKTRLLFSNKVQTTYEAGVDHTCSQDRHLSSPSGNASGILHIQPLSCMQKEWCYVGHQMLMFEPATSSMRVRYSTHSATQNTITNNGFSSTIRWQELTRKAWYKKLNGWQG